MSGKTIDNAAPKKTHGVSAAAEASDAARMPSRCAYKGCLTGILRPICRMLSGNILLSLGLFIVGVMTLAAIFAPLIAP